MNLKPYPEYKDSGVPRHWEMRKFRTILTPIAERNRPELSLLSVVREKGVIERNIKDDSENHNYIPDDLSNYKVVKSGQFAMNKMKAWQGSYGISKFHGIVSPAYFVFDLKCIEPDFFHKAVRSRTYVPFFTQASDGVRVGQWDLSQTRMKEMPFFIPSSEEQLAIARFLDYKTAQIARFIKSKKRMIELLKEQKQVIINDAVTGKIVIKDEGGRLKAEKRSDSSFIPHPSSFLQTVPEGWVVKRIKNVLILQRGYDLSNDKFIEGSYPVYGSNGIIGYHKFCTTKAPCITVGRSGSVGAVNFVEQDFWAHNTTLFVLHNFGNSWNYIFYILINIDLKMVCGGSAVPTLNRNYVHQLEIAVPPLADQEKIVSYIESQTAALDLTISRTEREIALMQEYRTRLISDVVTGKIDVRNIRIPDIDDKIDESIDEPEGEEELETAESEE